MRSALTIAGLDSAGGAGIHADLRTFYAHGLHGASAATVLTAQDTVRTHQVHPVPAAFVAAQIDAVMADLDVVAVKAGMLLGADVVAVVAERADRLPHLVVDPVLADRHGRALVSDDVIDAYRSRLLPRAAVVTPNRVEASLLVQAPVETVDDMVETAGALAASLGTLVVVTGGDAVDEGDEAVDAVGAPGEPVRRLAASRIETDNDHGSGCSLAAAVAAGLARGREPLDAVREAKAFVHRSLAGAATWHLGHGKGPIDHFGWGAAGETR